MPRGWRVTQAIPSCCTNPIEIEQDFAILDPNEVLALCSTGNPLDGNGPDHSHVPPDKSGTIRFEGDLLLETFPFSGTN